MLPKQFVLIFCGLMLCLSGCGGPRTDLVKTGKVTLEIDPGKRVNILNAYVYQDGEETAISAVIRRRLFSSYPLKINIVVSVIGPDGAEYLKTEKEEFTVPRYQPGKSRNITFYRKRIPKILPDGSIVRLICK